MITSKLSGLFSATALVLLMSRPAAAQSLNWVQQNTGVTAPTGDIAIGFTGPWVNVFYQQSAGQMIEIRAVRQFPVPNPMNNTQYIPYPAPLTTFPSNVAVELRSVANPFRSGGLTEDFALMVRNKVGIHPGETFLISTADFQPERRGARAVADAVAPCGGSLLATKTAADCCTYLTTCAATHSRAVEFIEISNQLSKLTTVVLFLFGHAREVLSWATSFPVFA